MIRPLCFLFLLFTLSSITDSTCQPNDEITESRGKTYRRFLTVHPVDDIVVPGDHSANVRNIILMIGDGMGVAQVYAGWVANKGALYLTQFPATGLSITSSYDNLITDSSAGATAMATGKKTRNGYVGIDPNRKPLETILEYCEKIGMSTGMVVTSSVTHATPACFVAHVLSRDFNEEIAEYFLTSGVDFFVGGGRKFFDARSDGANLLKDLNKKNFQVIDTLPELDSIHSGKVAGLIWQEHGPAVLNGRGDMLARSTKKAIEILNQNENGFFLMVEGSQIDWGGHQNDTRYLTEEMLDFDKAVGEALRFAVEDDHTLIIVTADHETGGFSVTGGGIRRGEVGGKFLSDGHTATWVPVYAFGPGEENFSGVYENSDIYFKMKSTLPREISSK